MTNCLMLFRLLNKLGGDLLGSIIQKINRTLDIVRDSFTLGEQMTVVMRFVGDTALTPNAKVKIATMKHLSAVAQLMEPSQVLQTFHERQFSFILLRAHWSGSLYSIGAL